MTRVIIGWDRHALPAEQIRREFVEELDEQIKLCDDDILRDGYQKFRAACEVALRVIRPNVYSEPNLLACVAPTGASTSWCLIVAEKVLHLLAEKHCEMGNLIIQTEGSRDHWDVEHHLVHRMVLMRFAIGITISRLKKIQGDHHSKELQELLSCLVNIGP